MKHLLRLIAIWQCLSVLLICVILLILASGIAHRVRVDAILLLGMVGTVVLGGVAGVQLWRLKHSGRYATLALFAFWVVLWVAAAVGGRIPSIGSVVRLTLLIPVGVVLVLPGARRVCT